MHTIHIQRFGEELGVVLPKELLAELGLREGDDVTLRRTENGVELTSAARDLERALEIARQCADEYQEALAILAKS